MSNGARRIIYGALGGAIGAACMTPLRLAARRRGWIEKTVSQTAEEWLGDRLGLPSEPALHHALDQMLHLGYGATLGVGYAFVVGRHRRPWTGPAYGTLAWFIGSWALLPALGAKRSSWRSPMLDNMVDLAAHVLYGAVTALVSSEMMRQQSHGPSSNLRRFLARTG
jgi:uncharacterized membrane protein YagU involved in acid resistance